MQKVIGGLIFLGGCTAGFVAGVLVTKKKVIAQKEEEIETIRQFYAEKIKPAETEKREEVETPLGKIEFQGDIDKANYLISHIKENPDLKTIAKEIMKEEGYSSDPDRGPTDEDDEEDEDEDPEPILERLSKNEQRNMEISYVIPPAECGECDYEVIELTYYADGVLVNDYGEEVDDPEGLVGPKALSSFGEYEEDTVYVRNDARRCDYCILKDFRNFSSLPSSQRR